VSAGQAGRGRAAPDYEALSDQLIAPARQQGVKTLGEGGLLKQMAKAILERSLAIELTDHLGMTSVLRPAPGRATVVKARLPKDAA